MSRYRVNSTGNRLPKAKADVQANVRIPPNSDDWPTFLSARFHTGCHPMLPSVAVQAYQTSDCACGLTTASRDGAFAFGAISHQARKSPMPGAMRSRCKP